MNLKKPLALAVGLAIFAVVTTLVVTTLVSSGEGAPLTRLTGWGLTAIHPAWSPDGNWIACTGDTLPPGLMVDPRPSDVYVMKSDGSGRRRLTDGAHRYGRPLWSRDSRRIYFGKSWGESRAWCWDIANEHECEATDEEVASLAKDGGSPDGNMRVSTEGVISNTPMSLWIERLER